MQEPSSEKGMKNLDNAKKRGAENQFPLKQVDRHSAEDASRSYKPTSYQTEKYLTISILIPSNKF